MILLSFYSVQVGGEMHFSVGERPLQGGIYLCLCKWQQLLHVAKGQRASFSKEKVGTTINPIE